MTEGVVEFTIDNDVQSFRYKVTNDDRKLQFWMEDMKSKQQWQTPEMEIKDFVHDNNTIPNAKIEDYVELFLDWLEADEKRTMTIDQLGCRELPWTAKLCSGNVVVPLEYTFSLQQLSLDKVDLISAQMREVIEDITNLKNSVKTLQSQLAPGMFPRSYSYPTH